MFLFFFNINDLNLEEYEDEFLNQYKLSISDLQKLKVAYEDIKKVESFIDVINHCIKYLKVYYKIYSNLPGQAKTSKEIYNTKIKPLKSYIIEVIKGINNFLKNGQDKIISKYNLSLAFETGRAHNIPYLSIQNSKFTSSATSGFYTVLFFDIDLDDVYISLNIGENKHQPGLQDKYKNYLKTNTNFLEFEYIANLEKLKSKTTGKNKHYFKNNIICSVFNLDDIEKSPNTFLTTLNKYLIETDRLLEQYDKIAKDPKNEINNKIFLETNEVDDYNKYNKYTNCSVKDCLNIAEYAVFLYDDYSDDGSNIFLEQDYTCPFICRKHLEENELNCIGKREPRTSLNYLHTNKHFAQGYSKYLLIAPEIHLKTLSEYCKEDYMDVSADIDSYANLILHEELELPLTFGIFGGWGSGKTFFTDALIKKIEDNSSDTCVVKFNAWNYYDSNITVNLVYNIFDKINNIINGNENLFLKKLQHYKNFITQDRIENISSLKKELLELEVKKTNNYMDFIKNTLTNIPLKDSEAEKVHKIIDDYSASKENVNEVIKEIDEIASVWKILKKFISFKSGIISLVILAIVISISYQFNFGKLFRLVSTFTALVLQYSTMIKKLIEKITTNKYYKLIKQSLISENARISSVNDKIESLKNEIDKIEKDGYSDITTQYLRDYITDKLNCESYKDNIGFISTVKEDINNLRTIISDLGKSNSIGKIILVIDDLDRCPEKKVVEVLQTIQLLLSTDLFIVIIAVDSKWVNNCITTTYDNMIGGQSNNSNKNVFAINYLEKIIHIPFWLKTLSKDDSFNFIEKLCGEINDAMPSNDNTRNSTHNNEDNPDNISDEDKDKNNVNSQDEPDNVEDIEDDFIVDDNTINNITLTENDIKLIKTMGFLFEGVSPRRIKRFFNTILLIKYKHHKNHSMYHSLLFGAASIVLKPQYCCDMYKYIFFNESCDELAGLVNQLEYYISNNVKEYLQLEFLKQYKSYIETNYNHLQINDFEKIIFEASRYTYYHEQIFGSN